MKEWSELIGKAILYGLIWVGFVGIVTNMDDRTLDNIPTFMNAIIMLVVFISPYFIGKILWSKGTEAIHKVSNQINEYKETQELVNSTKLSLSEYQDAKSRIKYISDELLLEKYNVYLESNSEDMNRLALEEELVDRKFLSHSPMHEKLERIKSKNNF